MEVIPIMQRRKLSLKINLFKLRASKWWTQYSRLGLYDPGARVLSTVLHFLRLRKRASGLLKIESILFDYHSSFFFVLKIFI